MFPSLHSRELTAAREQLGADIVRLVAPVRRARRRRDRAPRRRRRRTWPPSRRCSPRPTPSSGSSSGCGPTWPASSPPTAATTPPRACYSTLERDAATLRQLARPPGGVGGRPRARGAGRAPARSPPTTPSRCSAPRPGPSTRCPGPRRRSTPSCAVTGSSAWDRLHQDVTSQLTADGHLPRRSRRDAADDGGAGAGHERRRRPCAGPPSTPSWPPGRRCRHRLRRRPQRHQGRGQRRQRPPPLGRPARRVAVRQRRRPPHLRGHAGRRRRLATRLPALAAGQGPPPRPHRRAAVVGPVRPAAGRARPACRGPTGASG